MTFINMNLFAVHYIEYDTDGHEWLIFKGIYDINQCHDYIDNYKNIKNIKTISHQYRKQKTKNINDI